MVVDGRSTDGTQQILAEYGDRIRWISEKDFDFGQWNALNKGVQLVSGDVIAWLNSDIMSWSMPASISRSSA
ncbi:MAG TPA: glycosyltransferase [Dehalococcoidia bacterium]|jgi:glycosyltransferase involved in cell wall biosynthesis|nr:glycosyltransferase [Dehalococcoidia bacterium]